MTTEIGCTNLTELRIQESVGGLQPGALNDWLPLTPSPKFPQLRFGSIRHIPSTQRNMVENQGKSVKERRNRGGGKLPADSTGKSVKVDSNRWCGRKLSNKFYSAICVYGLTFGLDFKRVFKVVFAKFTQNCKSHCNKSTEISNEIFTVQR